MKIGVMQGRLLPKLNGQFQAFPGKNWKSEFALAANLSLDLIEFIFDVDQEIKNPLLSEEGLNMIDNVIKESGVEVRSVCADYFMKHPFYNIDNNKTLPIMKNLIKNAKKINIKEIVLPCIDSSSLNTNLKRTELIKNLNLIVNLLNETKITICIETDLNFKKNRELISNLKSPFIKLNYDTGNSSSLGFDAEEELSNNSDIISSFHIKDRLLNGPSVTIGKGDFNFNILFSLIRNKIISPEYIIMQVFRDNEGIEIFKNQLNWFKEKIINLHLD